MPERGPADGPVEVRRLPYDNMIAISATNIRDSIKEFNCMELSEYNAWRIFGMLALILEIPLPTKIGKEIKF